MRYQELTESIDLSSDGWLDVNAGEFHKVRFQKHASYIKRNLKGISYKGYDDEYGEREYAIYDHAYDLGWLRITIYGTEITVSGRKQFIKKGWKYLRKIALTMTKVIISEETHFLTTETGSYQFFVLPRDRSKMNQFIKKLK